MGRQTLQIDNDVGSRLRAANQNVSIGRLFERLRFVGDRTRNQTAFTGVANTGSARPTDRDIAGFGQLQNALIGGPLPVCRDAAAGKRYKGASVGVNLGHMWSARRCADDPRSNRLAAVEQFDVNAFRRHAHSRQRRFHVSHEASRSTEIDIRLGRDADLFEDRW